MVAAMQLKITFKYLQNPHSLLDTRLKRTDIMSRLRIPLHMTMHNHKHADGRVYTNVSQSLRIQQYCTRKQHCACNNTLGISTNTREILPFRSSCTLRTQRSLRT